MSEKKSNAGVKPGTVNNPAGRPKGAKNKIVYDVKKKLSEGLTNEFMEKVYTDIEGVTRLEERAKLRLKLLEFFIPKPREQEDIETENEFRRAFMDRMFPKKD